MNTLATPDSAAVPAFIVLAEDDIDDQELLIEAFNGWHTALEIHTVNNGRKAVSFLESLPAHRKPCLIVLDYNLPEMNGGEILSKISESDRYDDVTKIIWSTSNSPVYERDCLALGAKAYLVKPSDLQGVKDMALLMLRMCNVAQ